MTARRVFSSHIETIDYAPESGQFIVEWRGGARTIYAGVPEEVARRIASSPSIGEALHREIRGRFPFETIKPEGAKK